MREVVLVLAGVFAAAAVGFGFSARRSVRSDFQGLFALLCAMMVAYLLIDVSIWNASTAEQALSWQRAHQPLICAFFPLLLLLLARWTGRGVRLVPPIAGLWLLVAVVERCLPYGLYHLGPPELVPAPGALGGMVQQLRSPQGTHPGYVVFVAAWAVTIAVLVWHAWQEARHGQRGRSRLLVVFCVVLIGFTAHDVAVDLGWRNAMFLGEFSGPLLLAAMALRMHVEQRASQRRAVAQERAYSAVIDAVDDGILLARLPPVGPLQLEIWNPGMLRLTGRGLADFTREDWVGICLPAGDRDRFRSRLAEVLAGKPISDEEWSIQHRDGALHLVSLSCRLLPGAEPPRLWAVMRDISERRRIEVGLREAQKLESLGVLAGGIAHDFNNLLTAVLGGADIAAAALAPAHPAHSALRTIATSATRAAELCRQLLDYAGRAPERYAALAPGPLVREMLDMVRLGAGRQVKLELDLPPLLPCVRGDPAQLRQVVMNLVSNAAEAVGSGPGGVRIALAVRRSNGAAGVEIAVADDGCGMDAATRERIFEPFFTTKFTGRGLGLAAVQGIVRSHGGTITVTSEPGRGSVFRVWLPAVDGPAAAPASAEIGQTQRIAGAPLVLVVDDEEPVREIAADLLRGIGCRVRTACDGTEALTILAAPGHGVALVVMDLTMPGLGGIDTCRHLRTEGCDLPVLFTSGFSSERLGCAELGSTGFLQKPYGSRDLSTAVQAMLSRIQDAASFRVGS